jgi:probable HAF family extracellular repeat protein
MAAQPGWADPIRLTLTFFDVPGSTSTGAAGINNAGQIVGSYNDSTGRRHGFLDTSGVFTTLDFPGSTFTAPTGINNLGQIVGFYSGGVFLYANGTFSNLPIAASDFPFPFNWPGQVAINDSGQIVGTTADDHGFLYANGQLTFLPILPTRLNIPGTAALSINNAGVIAGSFQLPDEGTESFIYQNGQFTFPGGGLSSAVYGINNAGDYVINYTGGCGGSFLRMGGTFLELPPGPYASCFFGFARGLNDADQIVGSYDFHGFLATPVPEPASVLLLASGLAGMGFVLRRKKIKQL